MIAKLGLNPSLPTHLEDANLRAVVTGVLTQAQKNVVLSSFHVRRIGVKDLLAWYATRNPNMPQTRHSQSNLDSLPEDQLAPECLATFSEDAMKGQFGADDGLGSVDDEKGDEHAFSILSTAPVLPPAVQSTDILSEMTKVQKASADDDSAADARADGASARMSNNVHVSSSNKRAKSWEKGFLTKAFIELFPFARGGPEEERINPVSVAGCVQHYMRLSTRAFLGHRFILTAYGIIARSLASSKAFVRAKFRTGAASFGEAFAALDLEQIKTCASAPRRGSVTHRHLRFLLPSLTRELTSNSSRQYSPPAQPCPTRTRPRARHGRTCLVTTTSLGEQPSLLQSTQIARSLLMSQCMPGVRCQRFYF